MAMMMLWLFGMYFLLPLVEGAVIIVLAMVVGQRGRTIRELRETLERYRRQGTEAPKEWVGAEAAHDRVESAESAGDSGKAERTGDAGNAASLVPESGPASPSDRSGFRPAFIPGPRAAAARGRAEAAGGRAANRVWQGTAALVLGVVFVILAGVIFATTAWRVLPDMGKAVVVTAFSGIFFGASAVAERMFAIRRTAKAFYILGSLFLSVAVLAVGFFELLGPGLSLFGKNWCLVLLLGSVMTQVALVAGLKKYADPVYVGCSLAGFTVTAALAVGSLHPGADGFALGMAVYGLLVLALAEAVQRKAESRIPQSVARLFPRFASVNLWGISALTLAVLGSGPVTAAAAILMAGVHLYLGMRGGESGGRELSLIHI